MIPGNGVGDGVGLIEFAARRGIVEPPNEVKLIPGNPQSNGTFEIPLIPAAPGPATSVTLE